MSHYPQRRSSLNGLQGQDYDYNTSRIDGRIPYGPSSSVKPQSLPSRPVDPQGEHALSRKHYEYFSNAGIKATNAKPSSSAMSDLEKLRALKKAIMDGQLPGYNASPKPQALEALYSPHAKFTERANDYKTDTYHQHEPRQTLDDQSATMSSDALPPPSFPQTSTPQADATTSTASPRPQQPSRSENVDDVAPPSTVDPPAPPPLTDNPTQSVSIPQANDETEAASPTSMIMSPIESRLHHHSSITDMEIDSPPPSTAPPPITDVSQNNARTAPPADSEDPAQSAQSGQDTLPQLKSNTDNQSNQPPTLTNSRPEHRSEPGSPAVVGPSHARNIHTDESRRHEESRNFDYHSQPPVPGHRRSESGRTEGERTGPQSSAFNSQRDYRIASSPDSRHGPSGPPRPPNDGGRYNQYESGPRYSSNRSPSRSSVQEPKGYDSRVMDGGRVISREPYPSPPGDRSSGSARNFPYVREPPRFRDPADERRHPESSDSRTVDQTPGQRRLSETQRTVPPVDLSAPPPRASEGSRYPEERGSKYNPRPDFYSPTVPPATGRSLPFESTSGTPNIKAEASDDGEIGRRSATPRSIGESAGTRPSSFIPGRVPEGLPSRPPPTVEEPLTPRSLLMPDRIAPESRSYVPLAARLTSPNDYSQRGLGPPPPNSTRGPVDDLRYSSPTDHDPWSQSARTEEPPRRDTGYSRPDDARDYSRIVPRAEWDDPRSPPVDRYGVPISSRPPVPPSGYPYRDRSLSPPRRSGTYPGPGYPGVDDSRGTKRPRQDPPDAEYRRPPPLGWRLRDDYGPPPPPQAYPDPRGSYTRPPPPDPYRSYDRDPYPADIRSRPPPLPYGSDRDRYPPDAEWSGRQYRR